MKHNLLKSLIISVILLMGVSNAWALDIYLDISNFNWSENSSVIKLYPGTESDVQGSLLHLPSGLYVCKFTVPSATGTISFKQYNSSGTGYPSNEASIQYNASQNNLYKLTGWKSVENADYSISTVTPSNYIYFDNSITNWTSTNKYFVIGHDKPAAYSIAYTMYKIENTQLWYTHNLGNTWTDATYYSFFADNDAWSGNGWGISNIPTADAYTAPFTSHKNLNANKYYLCIPTNKSNNQPFNISEYSSYTDLNHTQTIKAQVKYGETNPAYQQVISPATITATTHYFGSDYTKVDQTGSLTINRGETDPARLTQTVTAAYTSTVTLSYTDLHEAYEFMDWWDDTNKKSISTSATCTYVATKATTIYARFKTKENYTHKIYLDARNWNADNPRYAVYAFYGKNEGQNEWIDMTPAYGTNWYYTCEVPAKYSHVIFCRMNPNNNNNTFNDDSRWGQTKNLLLLLDLDKNNCFTPSGDPTEQGGKTYDGNWSTPPTFTVTLEATSNGSFQVTCNGGERTGETINNVPVGTQLTITDIIPNAGYDQTMVYSTDGENYTYFSDSTEIDGKRTYTYTVNSDVTIAEDFRTTEDRDIYLKVTAKPYAYWCNKSNDQEDAPGIVYVHGLNQKEKLYNPSTYRKTFDLFAETNSYNIYKVTIPKGNNSFSIYPSKNHPDATRQSKIFRIPIASSTISCYELYNEEVTIENDIPSTNGQWRDEITVTIKKVADHYDSDGYGHITVQYNNTKYTSKSNEDVTFKTPIGSTITIVESQHEHPETYNGDLKYTDGGYAQYLNDPVNHPISAWGDIEITENFVVRKEVVEKKNLQVYLKIPKTLLAQWKENDVEEKGDNVRPGYDGNKFANFIWLGMEVKPGQSITGSTEAERGCPKRDPSDPKTQPEGSFLMYPVNIADDNYEIYYCTITDYDWHTIKFERKHEDSDPGVAQLTCADVQRFPGGKNNCFTITGRKNDGAFIGEWGEAPQCQVQMTFTNIGRYGFKDCFGNVHYRSPNSKETEFSVPWGSKVEVLEGEPGNDTFTGTVGMLSEGNTTIEKRFHDGENKDNFVTITRNTTFDDLFATKEEHVVYLGIPNEGFDDWYINNSDKMFAWIKEPYNELGLVEIQPTFVIDDITYYQYTLPAGIYEFNFQRKTGNNQDAPICQTRSFTFEIPVTEYNCFILDGNKNGNAYNGYWAKLPAQPENVGDYRVLYAEKELIKTMEEGESEEWETAFRTVYEHPSDIIKQTLGTASKNTVSLHITTTQERDGKTVHPMVILQQFQRIEGNTYDWVNLQAHTVLRLKATGNMGMLPGRKKAFGDLPFYDDGIEVIKNDTQYEDCTDDKGNSYKGSGVWNFVVNQASDGSVELDLSQTKRYQGEYYIRTNNAPGIWDQYTDNEITYSSYAEQYSGFSHYYCKWVDLSKHSEDVSFVIANDHATNLTDPSKLFEDQYITDEKLTENANVRWGWEHMTNKVSRAYIRGTWDTNEPPARIENIVVDYTPSEVDAPEQKLLYDSGDWIYSINLEDMKVGSKLNTLTAKYPSNGYTQTFAENINMLVGDDDNTKSYIVRILYDFKIDKTLVALVPNKNEATVGIDVLIERIDQGPATQVVAQVNSKKNNNEGSTVYGAFTFTQPHLTDTKLSEQEKLTYWFSFPFDVLLSDVYGFGEVGKYWMIKEYDGKSRAKEGLTEDNTFWKFITKKSTVLQANKGYVLTLNKRLMNEDDVVYTNTDSICLYFPSQNLVTSIDNGFTVEEDQVIEIPQWTGETAKKEWNWNLIGIPSYANKEETITADHLYYFFDYRHSNDTYEVMYLGDHTFKSTFAYMVQFAGDINWHTFKTTPKQLAAQKDASAEINHVMRLELLRNNQREDKTYIQLTENENATEQFDMNFDLTKMANAKANLYSLIGNHQLAANVLPLQTTIVPLGVIIKTAGEYTFAMPDGTDGIIAELIDYETNTRTNLLLDNYTVTLPAGTNNSRFALSLQPDKTVTSVDNIGNEATGDKVKKYLIDGVLYMQKDGVLYDAQGRKL